MLRSEGYAERAIFIIDREGVIRYVDVHAIDAQPDNEALFAELRRLNPNAPGLPEQPPEAPPQELPSGGVVIYCRSWCPDCNRAQAWLDARQVVYREVNIDQNPAARQQLAQWTGGDLITPTFDIDGLILIDFDAARLAEALGMAA